MKKYALILISIILILFSSCNPDSNTSIVYDMLHAVPTSDYRINTYVGDLDDSHIVLGTDKGITVFNLNTMTDTVIVEPIVRPLLVVSNGLEQYVLYYEQRRDQDATMKLIKVTVNSDGSVSSDSPLDAEFVINGSKIDITNIYAYSEQSGSTTLSTSYTIQEKEVTTEGVKDEERTINYYHYITSANNTGYSIDIQDNKATVSVSGASKSAVSSNTKFAPYVVGDGYLSFIDENESSRTVYDIRSNATIVRDTTPAIATCPDNEIVAYYGVFEGCPILADNSGDLFAWDLSGDLHRLGDFGSFPLDNRRNAYSTIIDNKLYLGFKYGPEVIVIEDDGDYIKFSNASTSDINDEDLVGIKKFGDSFYVVTEEASVIKTNF